MKALRGQGVPFGDLELSDFNPRRLPDKLVNPNQTLGKPLKEAL